MLLKMRFQCPAGDVMLVLWRGSSSHPSSPWEDIIGFISSQLFPCIIFLFQLFLIYCPIKGITHSELVFCCQGWPDPELDWWVCSCRYWVVSQGTKTPAVPSEMGAGTPHPSHARAGVWYRTGIPALLNRVRNSSSAEQGSKCHHGTLWPRQDGKSQRAETDTQML